MHMSIIYTRNMWPLLALVFVALLALVCGCVSDEPSGGLVETQPTGGQSPEQTTAVEVVHYTILRDHLPTATNNWLSLDPLGETSTTEEGHRYSYATAVYLLKSNNEIVVTVGIEDSGGNSVGYWVDWDSWYEYEDIEYSWKKTTVNGYPAWDYHDKTENIYIRYIGIDDRFIVYIISYGGDYITPFTNAMDLDEIASLA